MPELKHAVFVDDDADIRAIVQLAMMNSGVQRFEVFESGALALDHIQQHPPQLLMLDVMMPGMNGIALIAALRRNEVTANIPVIFVTAQLTSYEVDFYRSMGAISVISKPFNPITLPSLVLAGWRRYEEEQTRLDLQHREPLYLRPRGSRLNG